jgi:hypothetical protein
MGIFFEQIEAVNRTSKPLEIIYDGQRINVPANYTPAGVRIPGVITMVPTQVVPFALNQNVLMGSEDATDPSDFRSLIGFVDPKAKHAKSWHDISFLEQSEKLTRTPLEDVLEDATLKIIVRGKTIPRASDAHVGTTTAPFDIQ